MTESARRPSAAETADVVVIGAGATGLACATELSRRGFEVVVLEQCDGVGAAWRSRYCGLTLNSGRRFSALPGCSFPTGTATFPSRDDVVRYLESYRVEHRIEVRTGVRVTRIDPLGDGWRVTTEGAPLHASWVVVSTGLLARPVIPPELDRTDGGPPVVHSAHYADARAYIEKDVLVVGGGSSAMEIAHEIVDAGARHVWLSVRTPPNILPRSVAGMPPDLAVKVMLRMPSRIADTQCRLLRRWVFGDLRRHGLSIPADGPFTRLRRSGASPTVVDKEVIARIRDGTILLVPAVQAVAADAACLADGTSLPVDAIVAATGFATGLEPLVGHLGVLDDAGVPIRSDADASLPGLYFVNYRMVPGLLGAAGSRARRMARSLAAAAARDRACST